jgi:hypothetical protein
MYPKTPRPYAAMAVHISTMGGDLNESRTARQGSTMTGSCLAGRSSLPPSCVASLPSSWPPMAPGHGYHDAFDAGMCREKIAGRCSRGVRLRSRYAGVWGTGATALLGGRQWAVVASSVLVVMELSALHSTSRSWPNWDVLAHIAD